MKIQVLGCSGSIARDCRTTSFLLDDDVLIDAGTGVGDLSLDALERIDHILLTHSHLDHVLGVPLLADSVLRRRQARGAPPIAVHALPQTADVLRAHLFNNRLWPDFTCLPSAEAPVLRFVPFAVGDFLVLGGRRIEVLPAAHSVPACGFAVHPDATGRGAWVFSGDTGPNPPFWARLAEFPVSHVVVETAFSEPEAALAGASGHHCPSSLAAELAGAPADARLYITHIKPGEIDAVMAGLRARNQDRPLMELLKGDVFEF
ncbi:MAG TPA: 3',5'-cyclic-nucleotide phosphodiesterase [Burkholderiaceae bacterium]